ncbi:glycosyltransferase [Actinokineospora sp. 24-640]
MTDATDPAALLRAAADVTAGSVELSALVTGWESARHFSPARAGVLAPVRLRPGARALEFGCGSGAITRALGEAGLDVVAVESDPDLAEAARERCRDLANVRVTAEVPEGAFDLVVSTGEGGSLETAAAALSDSGVLVLAVTNRMGFFRLFQGGDGGWTRSRLRSALADAGLPEQRFLFPYPDWVVPRVVLDEAVFARDDAVEVVDKLVRHPFSGMFGLADVPLPGRTAHEMLLAEGAASATAPALLVLAARTPRALAEGSAPGLAWLLTRGRLPQWRRTRVLGADLVLHGVDQGGAHQHPWLRQRVVKADPLVPGRPLDACLLDALRAGDTDDITALLNDWRTACTRDARPPRPQDQRHPYLPGKPGVPVLPADHLDVHPGNLIMGAGGLVRVDLEWHGGEGVDLELVLLRALLEFAREAVLDKAPTPWPGATIRGLAVELAGLVGLGDAARTRWDELVAAEAAFQEAVSGAAAADIAKAIERTADAVPSLSLTDVDGGLGALLAGRTERDRLRGDLERATAWITERERELITEVDRVTALAHDYDDQRALLDHELAMTRSELAVKDDRIGRAFAELARTTGEAEAAWRAAGHAEQAHESAVARADELAARLGRTRARLAALEGSRIVRAANQVLWPAGRLVRGVRDLALARPGEESDGVLRRVARRAPGLTGALVRGGYRAAANRDTGLRFDLPLPSEPVAVGAGQVVELTGWVAHDALPVAEVDLVVGGHRVSADRGHHRPDVAAALTAAGVRAPSGSGVRFRVALSTSDADTALPTTLLVRLVDGTVLRRDLGALATVSRLPVAATTARWPGGGTRVAVCLATYRPDPVYLAAQLDSIRAQDHTNWVCVISDDGSGPASVAQIRALVAGDERFTVLAHDTNVGFYRNFERALACAPADADAIALSDQDDVWDADKLSTLAARLADPAVTLAYSDMRLIDGDGNAAGESFWGRRANQWSNVDSLLMLNTMTGASMLVRAEAVRQRVLPFPPGSPSAFHDQWIGAVALAGGRVEFVDRPLYSYRQHGANVTGLREDRLDDDLPGVLGLLRWALTGSTPVEGPKAAELEAVADYELARIAQFATVLSLRCDPDDRRTRQALDWLASADQGLLPLLRAAARVRLRKTDETAGAEHRLVAAALRKRLLRADRLALPSLPRHPD